MSNKQKFLVTIATQRSGTKFLGGCTNRSPLISYVGEIFHPQAENHSILSHITKYISENLDFKFRENEIFACLDDYFFGVLPSHSKKPIIHFDLMYNNLNFLNSVWSYPTHDDGSLLLKYILSRNMFILHLVRQDVSDCFISDRIAKQRKLYHTFEPVSSEGEMYNLSLAEMLSYCVPILQSRNLIRKTLAGYPRKLEIFYPDFIDGDEISVDTRSRISKMLATEPDQLKGFNKMKATAIDKKDIVQNYEEIKSCYRTIQLIYR